MRPRAAPAVLLLLLCSATAAAQAPAEPILDPIPEPIVKGGPSAVLVDFVQVPPSSATNPRARLNLLGHAGDGSGRLFVNDMRGKLWAIEDGEVAPQPFLDVAAALGSDFTDVGLQLGLSTFAFHPDFATPGADGFGVLYTAHSEVPSSGTPDFESPFPTVVTHHDVLAEWSVDPSDPSRIDPSSKRELLRVAQWTRDHNIGQIAFDPNATPGDDDYGNLYVAFGDGGMLAGAEIDPARTAQDLSNPFGSLLRIDPLASTPERPYGIPDDNPFVGAGDGSLGEIYAYGFRNPHRFSWDTGGEGEKKMIVSDIGQAHIEEIDLVVPGANYGWSEREGPFVVVHDDQNILLPLPDNDDQLGFTYPAAMYDHDEGRAVVGGFVYRGSRMPRLQGKYIFGDVVNGRIFMVDVEALVSGSPALIQELTLFYEGEERSLLDVVGDFRADLRFGIDAGGEIYVLTKRDGMVRRLVPEPASALLLGGALALLAAGRPPTPRGRNGAAARMQNPDSELRPRIRPRI